uniref:Uncharacterized protein n=1 Tax=Meloidogyne enterolobii TaxID=390850 RepID=A0A6V7Y0M1_MELEN|nr:unnamed protein product [Meloidogyne enterolobii]
MNQNLFSQILPEVDFNISSSGITVLSSRLTTPRFIPYDQSGRCKECKSTEVEIDFIVTKEGVTIYCTRIGSGTRFVPFDTVYELPTHCFFKVRNKGRVFNVPHGVQPQQIIHQNSKRGKRKLDELPSPPRNVSPTPITSIFLLLRHVSPTPPSITYLLLHDNFPYSFHQYYLLLHDIFPLLYLQQNVQRLLPIPLVLVHLLIM